MKYTEHLLDSFYNSSGCGTISGADVSIKIVDKETGDAVKYFFMFNGEEIKEVKFQACGSVVLFASLSAIVDLITGKTIAEALHINEKQIIKEIKQVNRCDYATIEFAIKSLTRALGVAAKKLEKGIENSKKSKVRNISTSKNIEVYTQSAEEEIGVENSQDKIDDVKENEKVEIEISPIIIDHEDDYIEDDAIEDPQIYPVQVAPSETIESIPTKIEVRVVEDEPSEEIEKMVEKNIDEQPQKDKKVVEEAKTTILISKDIEDSDNNLAGEDVIDEIDSITAKLTDAITKLNFKFDVDED